MKPLARDCVKKFLAWIAGSSLCALIVWTIPSWYSDKELALPNVIRISHVPTGRALQVPLLHYTNNQDSDRKAPEIDFISAVHIGEKSYYAHINQLLKRYDVVLFEMIADESAAEELRNHDRRDSSLGSFQRKLADLCGLSFQLEEIDYSAPNFVHADLSPEALREAMSIRGESLPQLISKVFKLSFDPKFAKALKESGFHQSGFEGLNPLLILLRGPTDKDRHQIKNVMAQGMTASESVLAALEGEQGLSLIDDRNARIISVLREQLGTKPKRIAIFYGAGHAPDLHARLKQVLGYRLTQIEWLNAWELGQQQGLANTKSR
jgi:hypothetical protein